MEPIKTAARHLAAGLAAVALAAGVLALAGTAARAAPGYPPGYRHAACTQNVPVTHTANLVQAHLVQTCGDRVRAIGWWGGKERFGTYLLHGYSTACDDPPGCQHHPDGSLTKCGWQDRRTGNEHTWACSAQDRLLALVKHRINLWTGKALKCVSCSNTTLGRFPAGIFVGSEYDRGTTGRNLNGGDDTFTCLGTTEGLLRLSSDTTKALTAQPVGGGDSVTLENAGGTGDTWCFYTPDGGTTWRIKSRYWSSFRGNTQELSIDCNATGAAPFYVTVEGASGVCQRFTLS